MLRFSRSQATSLASLLFSLLATSWAAPAQAKYEVWLVDQADSFGKSYGGTAYIFQGHHLEGASAASAPAEVIDLSAETSALCLASTGANPARPHMLVMNRTESHAVLSFVASGHVVVFDARTREPIYCTRMAAGAGGARQAHAVYPTADDQYVLVANQNGKRFERIAVNYCTNTFTYEPSAAIDLEGCQTPNGLPCQDATLRPDTAPICPFQASSGGPAFVSLRGGGMFAIDPNTTPMSIVSEWDAAHVNANGCGFQDALNWVYYSAGGGTAQNLDQFTVYRSNLDAPFSPANAPNVPTAQLLFNDPGPNRDAPRRGRYEEREVRLDVRQTRGRRRGVQVEQRRARGHGRPHDALERQIDAGLGGDFAFRQSYLPLAPWTDAPLRRSACIHG